MSDALAVGDLAPDFTLVDQHRQKHTLSDYRGKPVILMFYPGDFTSVCTQEHACMAREMGRFNALDAQLFGISVDSHNSHRVFAQQQGVEYPLLADFHPKGAVAQQYGTYLPDYGYTNRTVFVIAPDGTIADIYDPGFANIPDVERIAGAIERLREGA